MVAESTSGKIVFEKRIDKLPVPSQVRHDQGNVKWSETLHVVHVDHERVAIAVVHSQRSSPDSHGVANLLVHRIDTGELAMSVQTRSDGSFSPFAFSRDGNRVAAALDEPVVQIWDSNSGDPISQVPIPSTPKTQRLAEILALNQDGTKLAIKPGVLKDLGVPPNGISIVELSTGNTVVTPSVFAPKMFFTTDGEYVVTFDGTKVSTFDATSGEKLYSLDHLGFIDSTNSLSPDGRWIAMTTNLGSYVPGETPPQTWIEVVNALTGEVAEVLKGYSGNVLALAFTADSSSILTLQTQGIVTWPLKCALSKLDENDSPTRKNSPDGRWQAFVNDLAALSVASTEKGNLPGFVTLLDKTEATEPRQFPVLLRSLEIAFSPNSKYFVTVYVDQSAETWKSGELKVWDTRTGREVLSTRVPGFLREGFVFSADDRRIAIGCFLDAAMGEQRKHLVRIWDLVSGAEQIELNAAVKEIKFNIDGEKLFILPMPSFFKPGVWRKSVVQAIDINTWETLWEHQVDSFETLCDSKNALIAALVKNDGETQVVGWDSEDGHEIFRLPWFADKSLSALALDEARSLAAFVSAGKTKVFDLARSAELLTLEGVSDDVVDVAFSPDGNRIVTCLGGSRFEKKSTQEVLRQMTHLGQQPRGFTIWDGRSGQELLTLRLPTAVKTSSMTPRVIEMNQDTIRIGNLFAWNATPLSTTTEANELRAAGRSLLLTPNSNNENKERGLHFLRESLKLEAHNSGARSLFALALFQLGRIDEALSTLSVTAAGPADSKLIGTAEELALQAVSMHRRGLREEAVQRLQKAQRTASSDEAIWQLLIVQAKQIMSISPVDQTPDAWIGYKFMPRAIIPNARFPYLVSRVKGDRIAVRDEWLVSSEVVSLRDSIEYYTSVIAANPKNATPWNYRGAAYDELGEFDKAIDDYTRAIELKRDAAFFVNRGNLYVNEQQKFDMGLADFEQALAIIRNFEPALGCIANALRRMGKLDLALEKANEAIQRYPRQGTNFCERAYIHAAMGNVDSMQADFDKATGVSPDSKYVWQMKAWLLSTSPNAEHRNGPQAIEAATKACELTFWKDDHSLAHLAAAHAESGDYAQAVAWQKKAIELAPPAKRPKLESRLKLYIDSQPYRESIAE